MTKLSFLASMPDKRLAELAEELGIVCNEPSVVTYPDNRTKKAFMLAAYGDYSLAHKILEEKKHVEKS